MDKIEGVVDVAAAKKLEGPQKSQVDIFSQERILKASFPKDTAEGATLGELLKDITGLEKQTQKGPLGLAEFIAWWVGARSKAQLELKERLMVPPFMREELQTFPFRGNLAGHI